MKRSIPQIAILYIRNRIYKIIRTIASLMKEMGFGFIMLRRINLNTLNLSRSFI